MEKKYGKIGINSGMNDYFERALRPPAIKEETKKWTTLAGYVYLFAFFSHHKLTKFTRPTRREKAVPVPATWRFVSRSVQDAVRRGKDRRKRGNFTCGKAPALGRHGRLSSSFGTMEGSSNSQSPRPGEMVTVTKTARRRKRYASRNPSSPPKSPPSSPLLPTPASTTRAARGAELTKPAHAACRARQG